MQDYQEIPHLPFLRLKNILLLEFPVALLENLHTGINPFILEDQNSITAWFILLLQVPKFEKKIVLNILKQMY